RDVNAHGQRRGALAENGWIRKVRLQNGLDLLVLRHEVPAGIEDHHRSDGDGIVDLRPKGTNRYHGQPSNIKSLMKGHRLTYLRNAKSLCHIYTHTTAPITVQKESAVPPCLALSAKKVPVAPPSAI